MNKPQLQPKVVAALERTDASQHDIVAAMGYQKKSTEKAVRRLNSVLNDTFLGLTGDAYDLVYSAKEFLRKLLDVLEIDCSEQELNNFSNECKEYHRLPHPRIKIVHDFVRTRESVIALMAFPHTSIDLPKEWLFLDKDDIKRRAIEASQADFYQRKGVLKTASRQWANITGYEYHCPYGDVLKIDTPKTKKSL